MNIHEYLIQHNPYYSDVVIDQQALNNLPEDGYLTTTFHYDEEVDVQEADFDRVVPSSGNCDAVNKFKQLLNKKKILESKKYGNVAFTLIRWKVFSTKH